MNVYDDHVYNERDKKKYHWNNNSGYISVYRL